MGIPSFYRWLVERYPRSVADVVEETPLIESDRPVPVDVSLPNPNGYEFDNLYLDMNGIIHPCFHPEGLPPPSDYDEVFQAVFMYIDRVFSIVRPRQLLYLAIDGVAPRAKMNQQRSRRFKTAKEVEDEASLKAESHELGENELPVEGQSKKLDSNVITPGTEFMELLSSALRYYINLRMNEEEGWKGIKVILSDASVPGEGEHKIMSYIRLQRNLPGFNPNTRHCLYGLDADLIMLALASHEIHFSVLREEVRKITSRDNGTKSGHDLGSFLTKSGISQQSPAFLDNLAHFISERKFQFLHVWILREYLMYDLRIPDSTSDTDLERLIDDFVFMCLLVGNDFLPHIPSLAISEGAIDLLLMLYKKEFVRMGGYLTDSFKINFKRMEHFIQAVGSYESVIFRKRIKMKKASEWGGSQRRHDTKHMSEPQNKGGSVAAQGSANGLKIDPAAEVDKVKLGEDGWKERYYVHNFQLNSENECERIQRQVVEKYIEGLSWVMHYYYEGVCSWQWFYPFYYAPLASDFHGFDNLEIKFTLGKPFKPFDQLMGVLPAASAHSLPLSYGKLMKDGLSPIADFYPANFEIDMNGKRFSWQGICKLPFIDEARLLSEIAKLEHTLTDDEKRRNSLGWDILFVHKSNPLAIVIVSFSDKSSQLELLDVKAELEIDPKTSGGMNGYICIDQNPVWPREICSPINCWPALANIGVITVFYKYPPSHRHISNLPEGVILPDKSVSKKDIVPPQVSLYDGASFLLCSRKLMPKSVSGPKLSRFAHQLVLLHIAANTKGDKRTSSSLFSEVVDGKIASPGMSMVREAYKIIGQGAEITTVTQIQNKKKKRISKEEKQNDVAGGHPQSGQLSLVSVGEITTVTQNRKKRKKRRSKEEKQNGVAGGYPQSGHLSLASVGSLDSRRRMGASVGEVEGELRPEVNSEQGARISQQQFKQDENSDVSAGESGRLLAPCTLRDESVGINVVADGGHAKDDLEYREHGNIDEIHNAEPSSKKRRKKSKKRRRVEEVNNEETTEISDISAMKEVEVVCDSEGKESAVVSRVGRSDSGRTVLLWEEISDAHAHVNNKAVDVNVTPGIISGRKRKRYHAPGLKCPDAAGKAVEAVEPTSDKRKRGRSKEKTLCSEETNISFGKLEENNAIMKEAAVDQLLEKRSADDISESRCNAFTLNKSGAGIAGENPRESEGVHVGDGGVMEAAAEMAPY
ncbi:unnamed protein product [Linum trigynum]|uniref:Uncharacterized protein n=2 Tax=Linum trigynum TaxID=586398 RepID=A0AAV2D1V8_9ROSI